MSSGEIQDKAKDLIWDQIGRVPLTIVLIYALYSIHGEQKVLTEKYVNTLETVVKDCTKSHQEMTAELRTHKDSMRRYTTERSH